MPHPLSRKTPLLSAAIAAIAGIALASGLPAPALAQTGDARIIEEVVVVGTRAAPRTVWDSVVPVDVIGGADFVNQGASDLNDLLRTAAPAWNVNRQPISDAGTVVRPANLHGLASDHTLVLMNNKRRHRASVIIWLGNGVSEGAQGPDISPIPAIALKRVELLRDGASAQYGSDAIAGVLNFVLKDASSGGSIELKVGEHYKGDGEQVTLAGNIGLPFTDAGFFNFSFEVGDANGTDRSEQIQAAQDLIDRGNTDVASPAQPWGNPEIRDDIKLLVNLGLELDDKMQAYAFGNYAQKETEGGFYFRNPDGRSGVFIRNIEDPADPEKTIPVRLVGDLTADESGNCLTDPKDLNPIDPVPQTIIDDPDCFVFNELFPAGFTPRFSGDVTDFSGVVGVRGSADNGWNWDVSFGVGFHETDFFVRNTVNASLGPDTPVTFNPGSYSQFDKAFNIDLSKTFDVGLAEDLNFAAGFEWREEEFEVTVGEQASFEEGPLFAQGFSVGSNGFGGFNPLAGGKWSRYNIAVYVDVEAQINDRWLLEAAGRWEDFEDFGSTADFKLTSRYQVTDRVAIRGGYNTGFRAPTPGQANVYNVTTQYDSEIGLTNDGTIPPTNPVARAKGGKALEPEESENFTVGLVIQLHDNLNIAIDYFDIELTDRLALSHVFALTDEERQELEDSGVTDAGNLQNFRFFTNNFETETTGLDIVVKWSGELPTGPIDVSFYYDQAETEVDDYTLGGSAAGAEGRIRQLEEALPETRWNLSATHRMDPWRFLARLSYYDEYFDSEDCPPGVSPAGAECETYGDEYLVDVEVAYRLNNGWSLIAGAQNLLDEFPDKNPHFAERGNRYGQFTPIGFGGGFYYLRMKYDF